MRANMPRTGDRHVNKKPFRIAINLRESARFYPLDLQKIVCKLGAGTPRESAKTGGEPASAAARRNVADGAVTKCPMKLDVALPSSDASTKTFAHCSDHAHQVFSPCRHVRRPDSPPLAPAAPRLGSSTKVPPVGDKLPTASSWTSGSLKRRFTRRASEDAAAVRVARHRCEQGTCPRQNTRSVCLPGANVLCWR